MNMKFAPSVRIQIYLTILYLENLQSIMSREALKSLAAAIVEETGIKVVGNELEIAGGQDIDMEGVNVYSVNQAQITFLLHVPAQRLVVQVSYYQPYEHGKVDLAIKKFMEKENIEMRTVAGNSLFQAV